MKNSIKLSCLILLFSFAICMFFGVSKLPKNENEDVISTSLTEISTTKEEVSTTKEVEETTQIMIDVLKNKFFQVAVPHKWEYEQMNASTLFMVAPENINNFLGNIKIEILNKVESEEFSWEEFCVNANITHLNFHLINKDSVEIDSQECVRLEYFLQSGEYYEARTTVILELEEVTVYVTLAQDAARTYKSTFSQMLGSFKILK